MISHYVTWPLKNVLLYHRAKNLFSLKGKDYKEKRMHIYKFLLDHFTDEQRFNITTKISHSILGNGLSVKLWQTKNWCLYKAIRLSIQLCYLPVFTDTAVKYLLFLPCVFQHALWITSSHWTWKPVSCSRIRLQSLAAKKSSCQR